MVRQLLFVSLALAACGGQTQGGSDADGTDSGPGGPCPSSAPADGDDCQGNVQCEYGDDPRWVCNTVATCKQGFWSIGSVDSDCPTPTTNPPACAQLQPNATCSNTGTTCREGDVFCACIYGGEPLLDAGGPIATYTCAQPTPGCPSSRPKLGTTCTQANLTCSYAPCGTPSGLDVQCDSSSHTWVGIQEFCAGAN